MRIGGRPKHPTKFAISGSFRRWRSARPLTATLLVAVSLVALTMFLGEEMANAASPAVTLEQYRNGPSSLPNDGNAAGWVKGNAGSEQGQYAESHSEHYQAIMRDLPKTGDPVTIKLGYKTRHGGMNAIDYFPATAGLS